VSHAFLQIISIRHNLGISTLYYSSVLVPVGGSENPVIKSLQEEDLNEVGKKMMEAWGGKIIGKGKVLGKECDIWEISDMGTKTWIWNWIPLKTVTSMGMIITTEATEISEKCDKPAVKPNIKYLRMKEKTKGMESLGDMMKQFKPE